LRRRTPPTLSSSTAPTPRIRRRRSPARNAIREVAGQWAAAFDEFRCDVEEFFEVGDAVICAAHWHGRGRASGASTDIRQYDVYELRDGEVIRATLGCRSEEEAREAAGIME
jgi:ketosteroid isomerase-like protein